MGKNLWLRAKNKINLKPELKLEIVWNICDKELGGEWSLPMKTTQKIHFKTSKCHSFLEKLM